MTTPHYFSWSSTRMFT